MSYYRAEKDVPVFTEDKKGTVPPQVHKRLRKF